MSVSTDQLIQTINALQDAFATANVSNPVDLPQIVVIGSQSSGKSSVLENIVGRDFLPRGSGIVTRRPLILQLINVAQADAKEYGEFLHLPGRKFENFSEIREEIIRDTEAKTGKNAGISPLPINLRVFSPKVLTLTLVDLPGLTKVPVGDQPRDIEAQIRDMIMKFISKPNAIILAVTAANTDLANSDGLQIAREMDPEGVRTIGVLTKTDLMDAGTDVLDILAGHVIPLRLGYVPVVNRGQRDIESKKPIDIALDAEKTFFENHPAYKSKAQWCGTPFLAKKLNMILLHQIRNTLPEIKSKITSGLEKYSMELLQLGDPTEENQNPSGVILSVITEFCNDFRTVLDGSSQDLSTNELSGGARISFVLHEIFSNAVKSIDPFDMVKDIDIRTIMYNSSGSAPSLFVGTTAFEVIVKQQIRRLEDPGVKCITMIFDELVRILGQLLQKPIFKRYPNLREKFFTAVVAFFRKSVVPTTKLVQDLIACESTYINTAHPDFISGHRATTIVNERLNPPPKVQPPPQASDPRSRSGRNEITSNPLNGQMSTMNINGTSADSGRDEGGFFTSFWAKKSNKKPGQLEPPPAVLKASGSLSEREVIDTEIIKLLIQSYFNIVKRTVSDLVPKAIMYSLVVHSKDNLQRELLSELYAKKDTMEDAMKESEFVSQRRTECKKMIAALQKADEIVAKV